ncbi:hypothetical protein KAFR_0H00410 [Kazachstania africana CBS 2517]|uniref:Uncharacterized protein n=1 Tax=Kazachstania africana (strain ATCC 22294 / BCRC 22015 / CBS 2517 / CECT 1963 / NBRC 1671 / NRRL Y-8276) TaxID=1071382 RepID=H2AYP4_KAZAF|nr:hypothetical protein KAFR_0H00410 [Kazachstania africana CBS 2517]CCF59450.1 hypothetical protein KAFR_0H00410 [Kazachstania africana CBS 2517]
MQKGSAEDEVHKSFSTDISEICGIYEMDRDNPGAQTNNFEQSSRVVSECHAETSSAVKNDRNKPPKSFPIIVQSTKTNVGRIKKAEIKIFSIASERLLLDALETRVSGNTPSRNPFKPVTPIRALLNQSKGSNNNGNLHSLGINCSSVPTSISSQYELNTPQTPDTRRPKIGVYPSKGYQVREASDFIEPEYIVGKSTMPGSIFQNNRLKSPCTILPKINFTKKNLSEDGIQTSGLFNCMIQKDRPLPFNLNFRHRTNITKPFGLTPMYSSKFRRCMNTTTKNNILSRSFN